MTAGSQGHSRSDRLLLPCLLRRHVSCVPRWPVRISLTVVLLVFPVGGCRTPNGARQIVCRCKRGGRSVQAAGVPRRDLLDQPRVAVGIVKGEERPIARTLRVGAGPTRLKG